MDKPSTSKTDNQDSVKVRKKSAETIGEVQNERNTELVPLHKRRFDAKKREFPRGLTALPRSNLSPPKKPEDTKQFCNEFAERVRTVIPSELRPLSERSACTAAAMVATDEAFDHLDKLYKLMDQLLTLKDQNSKLQRRVRDLEYLKNLQDMHKQIEKEIQRAKTTDASVLLGNEATSMDLEEEYGYTEALLDSMLAAGRNASLKRAKWKSPSRSKFRQSLVGKQRSRSMGGEELENCGLVDNECSNIHLEVPYRGRSRRQSEMKSGDEKSKISKWTRVKAAFKWEKAHTGVATESFPSASLPAHPPIPPAQPLPAVPITPTTPGSMSSASSVEELQGDNVCQRHESARRSRSLDSSVTLDPLVGHLPNDDESLNPSSSKLHKTPWGKMKDIIQTRKESVKKNQNRNSIKSQFDGKTPENYSLSDGGYISHSGSAERVHDGGTRSPGRKISSQEKNEAQNEVLEALKRTTPTLTITMPSSEELTKTNKVEVINKELVKSPSQPVRSTSHKHQGLKKQISLDQVKKMTPKTTVQDSSDPDTSPVPNRNDSKWKKVKKAFPTSTSASTPSSPSRHSTFFGDDADELSSGEYHQLVAAMNAGPSFSRYQGDGSRGASEARKANIEEEIRRDYEALQSRLSREFSDRALGWSNNQGSSPSSSRNHEWEKSKNQGGSKPSIVGSSPPTPGPSQAAYVSPHSQERIEADFRRRLQDNQRPRTSIAPVLSQAQLSEDFRKKLEEWKKLKATNSVPPYTGEESERPQRDHDRDDKHLKLKKIVLPPKKEVLVQTGAGFFRFEGISRSFTRKLHEWEKSRGIAPEASTSALLRESLARPPVPALRNTGYGPWPSSYDRPSLVGSGICRLQRSQSAGSVREEGGSTPATLTAGPASSLSLNRLDECQDDQVSDGDLDVSLHEDGGRGGGGPESSSGDSDGGPAALLVEVEDEEEETAAPLVACSPRPAPQTPVYRYGQAQERHRACENTEGKLAPIAHAAPIPPHPGTDQISQMLENIAKLVDDETTLHKLIQGQKNITERCEDVQKQIDDIKALTNKPIARLGELERRLSRLSKERGILQNSTKERAAIVSNSASNLRKKIDVFKSKCDDQSDPMLYTASCIADKVKKVCVRCIKRANGLRQETIEGEDLLCDFEDIQQSIYNLRTECERCNNIRKDNNLCISYTVSKPKQKNTTKESISRSGIKNIPHDEVENSNLSYEVIPDIETPKNSDSEKNTTVKNKSSIEDLDDSSKGAKKKSKEALEKVAGNNTKRKMKARQRLEKEKSIQSESDSNEEVSTVTIEFPRRRKLVRTRRTSDTHVVYPRQNSFEKQSDSGDNVYVLKLKSTNENSNPSVESDKMKSETKRTIGQKKRSLDSVLSEAMCEKNLEKEDSVEILISPEKISIDIPPEGIEIEASGNTTVPDVFVKTTRKIFSPVRRDSKGKPKAVIGFDLDEIASSIEKSKINVKKETHTENANQDNLPDVVFNEAKKTNTDVENLNIKNDSSEHASGETDINRKQYAVTTSESLSSLRSHTPSPLFSRRCIQQSSPIRILSGSRDGSEESIHQPKDVMPLRRGSGERYFNGCKGSPVLSRSSTPGMNGASSLPPLPASPPSSRREKNKETAPSIRIMIQKYNMRLNEEGLENKVQTGSNTPPWRSPRSQERFPHDVHRMVHTSAVRNNPFFNHEVQKSASASQIMKNISEREQKQKTGSQSFSKENVSDSSEMTPPMPKKLLRGILKSSSAGSLKTSSPLSHRREFIEPPVSRRVEPNKKCVGPKDNFEYVSERNTEYNEIERSDSVKKSANKIEAVNVDQLNKTKLHDEIQEARRMNKGYYARKIDSELLKRAMSTPCAPLQLMQFEKISVNRTGSRAMRLKHAREQFLADLQNNNSEIENSIRRERNVQKNADLTENRLSQISCGSDTSYEGNSPSTSKHSGRDQEGLLLKSASVGMIDVEREAFEKFNRDKGYESLPRNQSNLAEGQDQTTKSGSRFGLSNLASKFRKVRMRKGKQNKNPEEKEKSTISKLCRQSLLINLQSDTERKSINNAKESGGSVTDMSIVSAGKTGGAVAVGNEGFFAMLDKGVCRSMSAPDGSECSKNFVS